MRTRQRQIAVALLPTVLLLSAFACADKWLKAATASDDFAISLEAFQKGEADAHTQGFVDTATHRAIQTEIGKLALAGQGLNNAIRVGKSAPDAQTAVKAALDASQAILDSGITNVKDPATKQKLQALVVALRAPLTLIATLFA